MRTTISEAVAEATKLEWIYPLSETQSFVFGPPLTVLIIAIRSLLIDKLAVKHGFSEWIFPRLIPEEVLAKTGWLTHHRSEAWNVSPKREFAYAQPDENGGGLFHRGDREPIDNRPYVLDPIQCVSFYYAFYSKSLKSLPIKAYEYQGGWTFRYETNADGILRGKQFLRLEFVWLANEKEAQDIRNVLVFDAATAIDAYLQVPVKVAEGDSCFEHPPQQVYAPNRVWDLTTAKERAHDLPSIDLLFDSQHQFPRSNEGFIELASAGRHNQLPPRYKIKQADSTNPVWSGCCGLGLTRLVFAFLAVHGFSQDAWPNPFRDEYYRPRALGTSS